MIFAQRCVLAMPKTWPSSIFEKFFFRPKIPEIRRKSPFLQIFIRLFPYISLFFFSHKNIINNNFHHQAWFNCQQNWFLKPELSKNRQNSRFSPEKRYLLDFWSCTSYFCTLMLKGNALNKMEPDFRKTYLSYRHSSNLIRPLISTN